MNSIISALTVLEGSSRNRSKRISMALPKLSSVNELVRLRLALIRFRKAWLKLTLGLDIDESVNLSLSSRLRPGGPGSIQIGRDSLIAFKTLIYSVDPLTGEDRPIAIGRRCFIGGGSTILPGVTIGDGCIVGAASVVFDSVPPGCIVGGNPARVLRTGIKVGRFGRMALSDAPAARGVAPSVQR
jgi:maltose O-acetyltransferase